MLWTSTVTTWALATKTRAHPHLKTGGLPLDNAVDTVRGAVGTARLSQVLMHEHVFGSAWPVLTRTSASPNRARPP